MKAVCDWCLAPVKASKTYDPLQHPIYCSQHCVQKDWLFKRWQSDERLNEIAERAKDG